ncbi:MAG TPA: phosphoglucosamine mutase [Mycobacteriales bacterium]|nr:phosphoglucosamine mutase [Mycobacteriales bacterium]
MARLFGTDGIRGLANGDVLTPELAMRLAAAAARHLLAEPLEHGARPVVVIGRDTRPSGEMLEAAAFAGFTAVGCDVVRLGVVPTPAVAYECQRRGVLGLMVSASHNPVHDNGLKLFTPGGEKLTDADEDAIEALLGRPLSGRSGVDLGTEVTEGYQVARRDHLPAEADATYVEHLLATVGRLDGLHVVVDGAQGAASSVAPQVYRSAGATVTALHCEGNGWLINDGCGATHPESLAAAVVEHGADLGIAHDGDADRCIVVDASGTVLNGDQVLGLLALARKEAGLPASDVLVATVMSNLGLHHAMAAAGIRVVTTAVGDRYVLEEMRAHDFRLGGEQSGHVVLADHATTGDGLLTALQVMDRVARTGRSVAELASVVRLLPQVLVNVRADRARAQAPDVLEAVAKEEAALAGAGRVLLRPSGTEALVRVMVEAPSQEEAETVANRLAGVVSAK